MSSLTNLTEIAATTINVLKDGIMTDILDITGQRSGRYDKETFVGAKSLAIGKIEEGADPSAERYARTDGQLCR